MSTIYIYGGNNNIELTIACLSVIYLSKIVKSSRFLHLGEVEGWVVRGWVDGSVSG